MQKNNIALINLWFRKKRIHEQRYFLKKFDSDLFFRGISIKFICKSFILTFVIWLEAENCLLYSTCLIYRRENPVQYILITLDIVYNTLSREFFNLDKKSFALSRQSRTSQFLLKTELDWQRWMTNFGVYLVLITFTIFTKNMGVYILFLYSWDMIAIVYFKLSLSHTHTHTHTHIYIYIYIYRFVVLSSSLCASMDDQTLQYC